MIGSLLVNECMKQLRSSQSYDDSECSVSPQGRPWPSSGKFFVGLFCTQDENADPGYVGGTHRARHSFTARISKRVYGLTPESLHKLYVAETSSIMYLANTVRQALLDTRVTILQAVNTYIEDTYSLQNSIGLNRPFEWLDMDSELTERDDEWFWSEDRDRKYMNIAGYSIDVTFGQAEGNIVSAQ